MLGPTGAVTVTPAVDLIESVLPSKVTTVPRTIAMLGAGVAGGASAADAALVSTTASATPAIETRMDFPPRKARNRHQQAQNRKRASFSLVRARALMEHLP